MKFKVGDKVIGNKKATENYLVTKEGCVGYVTEIFPKGCIDDIRVDDVMNDRKIGMRVDSRCFDLYEEGIAPKEIKNTDKIQIDKIIFNDPATILYADGERYISKSYNETFDEEKGLALTLLKVFGISYLDLQRMIKGATVQEKKASKDKKKESVAMEPTHLVQEVKEAETQFISPKGRKKGKAFIFNIDDKVLIRDCDQYENTTNATARAMLNKVWRVQEIDIDNTIVINGVHFEKCEVEKLKF